jgi:uncharacterized protein
MTLHHILLLAGSGFAAGVINAIAGGGTILTFPALLLAGVGAIEANATSTVALIVGIVGSLTSYRRNLPAVAHWLRAFTPVSLLGGLLGSVLLTCTPSRVFDRLVPFLILFATVLFLLNNFLRPRYNPGNDPRLNLLSHRWLPYALTFQFFVAVYGGYFGAGIGILMLATLGMMGLHNVHEMNTVKTVLGGLVNIVAALYFIAVGLVDWPKALIMAAGASAGYYGGAHFAQSISQNSVRRLIALIGFAISAYMFYIQFVR